MPKPGPKPLPKSQVRSYRLPVYLNRAERTLVRRLANEWSCTAAEVMRRLLAASGGGGLGKSNLLKRAHKAEAENDRLRLQLAGIEPD